MAQEERRLEIHRMRLAKIGLAFILALPAQPAPVSLYLIGDSTMADKPDPEHNPERGWGQALPNVLGKQVSVYNHAVNGRSSKSFLDEGRWAKVRAGLHRGDFVVIQFGHNDEKLEDTTRYAAADAAYKANLAQFVRETRLAGATPILLTPIVRRNWNASGALVDTHGKYPDAVREVAKAEQVQLIDAERLTADLLNRYGAEQSKLLFVWTTEGQFAAFPAARSDNTHLSPRGAREVAELIAKQFPAQLTERASRDYGSATILNSR